MNVCRAGTSTAAQAGYGRGAKARAEFAREKAMKGNERYGRIGLAAGILMGTVGVVAGLYSDYVMPRVQRGEALVLSLPIMGVIATLILAGAACIGYRIVSGGAKKKSSPQPSEW